MLLKLASRNIWRNRRRTFITAASIMFAVFFATLTSSFQGGAWDSMINTVVNSYYGFAQVQQKDYWEERIMDNALPYGELVNQLGGNIENINDFVPRLENFTLISVGDVTKVGLIIGTDPETENQLSNVESKIVAGSYLEKEDQAVIITDTLARELGVGIGDTIAFMGMGYHGANAVGAYPIKGLIQVPIADLRSMVYLPYNAAQELFAAYDMATSLVVNIKNPDDVNNTVQALNSKIDTSQYSVMSWREMMPEILEAKELDSAGNNAMFAILYIIIAFGIFGTILMMIKEREYEFGVLTAIGMKRGKIGIMVWLETVFIGLLGAIGGILISLPIVYYFNQNPLDVAAMSEDMVAAYAEFGIPPTIPFSMTPSIFIKQAITVFIILTLLAIYPMFKIRSLKPVEAMRH